MPELQFEESQQFRSKSLWIFLGIIFLFLIGLWGYIFIRQIVLDKTVGPKPASDLGIIFTTILVYSISVGIVWLFLKARLTTLITSEGIWIRYVPFRNRKRFIPWNQIQDAYVRKYEPIKEFGGWGYRFGFKGGVVYNVSGRWGLQIVLKNGKKILIGTQKPEELKKIIQELK